MVKSASAAFVLLLLGAHGVGEFSRRLAEPLSMFRDGEQAWLGYVLFATLLLVSIWYTRDMIRAGEEEEAVIAGLAALLLKGISARGGARVGARENPVGRCRRSRCDRSGDQFGFNVLDSAVQIGTPYEKQLA